MYACMYNNNNSRFIKKRLLLDHVVSRFMLLFSLAVTAAAGSLHRSFGTSLRRRGFLALTCLNFRSSRSL